MTEKHPIIVVGHIGTRYDTHAVEHLSAKIGQDIIVLSPDEAHEKYGIEADSFENHKPFLITRPEIHIPTVIDYDLAPYRKAKQRPVRYFHVEKNRKAAKAAKKARKQNRKK